MGRRKTNAVLVAGALALAVGIAGLSAPLLVELLSWDSDPALRRGQAVTWFWVTLPVAAGTALLGIWIGSLIASDGLPLPGWRAWKWGAAAGLALGIVLLPLGGLAVLLAPVGMLGASSSGAVTAFLLRKGTHGKA
jgi:hypothetical protein